jgi:parvulin-like peptidyl-prolyl isomerase
LHALQAASGKELIALLFRFDLAEPFLRQLKEREVVFNYPNLAEPESIRSEALARYCQEKKLTNAEDAQKWCLTRCMNESDLVSEAIHAWRRQELQQAMVTATGETLYLRYKDKLDRVLYSLLRLDDPGLCQELYYAIEAGEISFADAAERHSSGPEAKTKGIVGPVDLTTPHPEIASRLRTAQAGTLIGPFMADQWHTIIRMDYRFDSEYDESTKEFLKEMTFKAKIGETVKDDVLDLYNWLNTPRD